MDVSGYRSNNYLLTFADPTQNPFVANSLSAPGEGGGGEGGFCHSPFPYQIIISRFLSTQQKLHTVLGDSSVQGSLVLLFTYIQAYAVSLRFFNIVAYCSKRLALEAYNHLQVHYLPSNSLLTPIAIGMISPKLDCPAVAENGCWVAGTSSSEMSRLARVE